MCRFLTHDAEKLLVGRGNERGQVISRAVGPDDKPNEKRCRVRTSVAGDHDEVTSRLIKPKTSRNDDFISQIKASTQRWRLRSAMLQNNYNGIDRFTVGMNNDALFPSRAHKGLRCGAAQHKPTVKRLTSCPRFREKTTQLVRLHKLHQMLS